ncbi:hypothetical protein I6A60_16485 [Frankia sp. AgB1.9]|uniref:DUF2231 domain-containing protein n=1 Tax=unclassified Frankia TaxID=2632575 RepID=UPI0019342B45|nr:MULTISPECIES: DUF2231 domain-containing protein [unclassified Frankia]MBL7488025.1 hypothetical protein [Frankia sp. AgW1.1]MBL7549463.1 hypothetical protein [Frankia sp. AgB1.9]MBL7619921.1 hypothetical protein [Frankia sp. AgB1.8]
MPSTVFGLPTHILIIHATVVLVPLTALMLCVAAFWPRLRRALGPLPTLAAFGALILVPITSHSGEQLRARLPDNPLIARHAELGDTLLPWVAGLFVAALLLLWNDGWRPTAWASPTRPGGAASSTHSTARHAVARGTNWVTALAMALVIATAVGSVVQIVRIGHSGAKAAWSGVAAAPVR